MVSVFLSQLSSIILAVNNAKSFFKKINRLQLQQIGNK